MDEISQAEIMHTRQIPSGYFMAASGDVLPWFDQESVPIELCFMSDGTVRWRLTHKKESGSK